MKKLLLILGPTASGKTAHAVRLAQQLETEIVSCDSRQFYTEMDIGVARPTPGELAAAPHHFIACRSVLDPFNVYTFEQEALALLGRLFATRDTVIATGGSGLYIEALCHGIALLPDPDPRLREMLQNKLKTEGVVSLQAMLRDLDPDYYSRVDRFNGVRLQRALEVCLTTGRPYSQVVCQPRRPRPFAVEPVVIERGRDELRSRISVRVGRMMEQGLEEEARRLLPFRRLAPLNTVGYKEFFSVWDGNAAAPLTQEARAAVAEAIRLNTWHYAKKQLTWLKKYAPALNTLP